MSGDDGAGDGEDTAESPTPIVEENGGKAIVRNRTDGLYPQTAVFDIRGVRRRAGDWISTVKKDLERRFGKVEVHTPNDGESQGRHNQGDNVEKKKSVEKKKNMFEQMGEGLEQIHPLHVMNEGVKDKLKETALTNKTKIVGLLVEASLYCCVFHAAKQGAKKITKDRKYIGPAIGFVSDVALPNGLYGPIFGFLIRLNLPF